MQKHIYRYLQLLIYCSISVSLSAAEVGRRPNIIFVIADQWRASAFGYTGNPNVKTPNIDAFAKQSVSFKNAVSNLPVCTPMRATLMTGQRPLTHGLFLNDAPLNPEAVTMAKVFAKNGFDTAMIGKWHIDGHGRSTFIPKERRQGFDYWKVLECTHAYNQSAFYGDGPEKQRWEGYDSIAQTNDACKYIESHAKGEKPFLMVMAWGPPHDPYMTAPAKYREMYKAENMKISPNVPGSLHDKIRSDLTGYYAHCTALDDCFGQVVKTCREAGILDNTIIIFTADHGDMMGSHGARYKQQPYEESACVPMLFHCPKKFGDGRITPAIINTEDLMPTVLSLSEIPIPESVEGRSVADVLQPGAVVKEDQLRSAALITCVVPFGQFTRLIGGKEYRAVRTAQYTYAADLKGAWLLFDNQADPYQQNNLIEKPGNEALLKEMQALLKAKLQATGDEFKPASYYVEKWKYVVDKNETIRYTN